MIIVYPYLKNYSRELEWSIKSLKFYKNRGEVFVVGDKPDYEVDATFIKPIDTPWNGRNAYGNVIAKLLQACELGDEFMLMNDDIFLTQDYGGETFDRGTIQDHINNRRPDAYSTGLRNTLEWLKQNGYTTKDYEMHTPMVFNSDKLKRLIEQIQPLLSGGHAVMIRSLYGNVYKVPSQTIDDVKNPTNPDDHKIISTNESTFLGYLGIYVRSKILGLSMDELPAKHTISVVIPVWNAQDTIIDCLDSIPDHKSIKEIIVCDDKSTDKTLKILKSYKNRPIIILENEVNRGVGYTFNKLLDNVTGDYVLRVDSDDKVRPEMTQVLDQVDGKDIYYYNMVDFPSGTLRQCTPENKRLLVANFHIYKTSLIGDTRTIETNWGEDAHFLHALLEKNPTEVFTNINAYGYNYPRADSLTGVRQRRKKYLLAVMTNCTNTCLSEPTIFDTMNSWKATFGEPENIEIFLDPNPNPQLAEQYSQNIKDKLGVQPIITTSLSDGYRRALDMNYEFIFYLEHDWALQGIRHSLGDILGIMKTDKRWFMLFNQHKNIDMPQLAKYQSYLKRYNENYCITDRISNNPHIIWREMYRSKAMHLVDWSIGGAGWIEQALEKKFEVAVYGEYGKDPTIIHTDGRKGGKK